MTTASVARPRTAARDHLGAWCGWVMVGAAGLTPLIAWLAPRGFAALLAAMGLLCLPAVRVTGKDRPLLIVLLGALIWAAVATTWSPYHPDSLGHYTILQLAADILAFWSAICGARRADPRLSALALKVLAWGLALFGAELIAEAATGAGVFRWLHERYYQPIRVDLAQSNVAHSSFVLALLWPAVLVGGARQGWGTALLAFAVAGTVLAAHAFGADAPVLALPLASATMLLVWLWPSGGPRLLAFGAASVSLLTPAFIWAVRARGRYGQIQHRMPLSWAARMSYWSHTIDWIGQRPVRGWGLDASRAMGPGISLHPHNGSLQVWLELGAFGAVATAAFWGLSLSRISRNERDLRMAGVAGSTTVFLLFTWVSFGVWQQWWLALGAYVPVIGTMLNRAERTPDEG